MALEYYFLSLDRDCEIEEYPFIIRGLWPQYEIDKWPVYKEPARDFDLERMRPLLPELHKNWNGLRGPDDYFWEHQWLKYGMATGMTEVEYFSTILVLFSKVKSIGSGWVVKYLSNGTYNVPFDLNGNVKKIL